MRFFKQKSRAFTLLEILLVVAAIGILAAIVIVAINPNRQLPKVRDSERQSEVNTLYDAIQQYNIDNSGRWPSEIENMDADSAKEICRADKTCGSGFIEIAGDLTPTYVADLPEDPQVSESNNGTGYAVVKDDTNRLAVEANRTELQSDFIAAGDADIPLLGRHPGAAAAYSVRKLDSGYTGAAMEIRRGGDDATTTIGFDAEGNLDTTEVTDFVDSSGNAYVTTWYDQSGNGRDATQTTQDKQPQIVDADTVTTENGAPVVDFDGNNDVLEAPKSIKSEFKSGQDDQLWAFELGRWIRSDGNRLGTFGTHEIGNYIQDTEFSLGGDQNRLGFFVNDTGSGSGQKVTAAPMGNDTYQLSATRYRLNQGQASITNYLNGSPNDSDQMTVTDQTYTAYESYLLGARSSYDNFTSNRFHEVVVYDSNQSANRGSIESNINDWYGVY
jgi:prepilin-type N-terminal cleavage/methylation domain-containing protein